MAPRSWIAASRFTITRRAASRLAPLASVTVTTIGSSSGVRPTARASANSSDSSKGRWNTHIGDRDEQHEEDGQPQHQESELADAALERIAWPLHGQSVGKAAKLGGATGADDEAGGHAADHRGAHAQEVRRLPRLLDRSGEIDRVLLGRVGFAGEQGLVDEQIARGKQPAIAWHDVAGPELDHVARHQPVDGDLHDLAVAEHLGLEPHRPAQGVDRVLGPRLLDHVEHDAQQDDDDDE